MIKAVTIWDKDTPELEVRLTVTQVDGWIEEVDRGDIDLESWLLRRVDSTHIIFEVLDTELGERMLESAFGRRVNDIDLDYSFERDLIRPQDLWREQLGIGMPEFDDVVPATFIYARLLEPEVQVAWIYENGDPRLMQTITDLVSDRIEVQLRYRHLDGEDFLCCPERYGLLGSYPTSAGILAEFDQVRAQPSN